MTRPARIKLRPRRERDRCIGGRVHDRDVVCDACAYDPDRAREEREELARERRASGGERP